MAKLRATECREFIKAVIEKAEAMGAPVFKGDEMVGALGISGGTSQQDEEMANYALAKVGWAKVPEHDTTDANVKEHVNALYEKAGIKDRL